MIQDFSCGMNTMLMRDHKNRVYKTGLKLDYTPKLIKFNEDLLPNDKIKQLACGKRHYIVLDTDNNLHTIGPVFKDSTESSHDGFSVHDGDKLFDGGKVRNLSVQYEIYGAVVDHL